MSAIEYNGGDVYEVGDFLKSLQWNAGDVRFSADYVKGRCMKTQLLLRADGTGQLSTTGRGKSASHWLDRLHGKARLQRVDP